MNLFYAAFIHLALLLVPFLIISSCNKLSPAEKQAQYMAAINAQESAPQPIPIPGGSQEGQLGLNVVPTSVPDIRSEQKAICGNGIIEGDEYCDRDNISHRKCTDFQGISGEIGCTQDCLLDISRCITPEVDVKVGGISEVCKCTCNNDNCQGGCTPIGDVGQGRVDCLFRCDNSCTCRCEGKTETHIEYCNITCQCDVDNQGNPQCFCNLDECEFLNVIVPNIAELASRKARFPLTH